MSEVVLRIKTKNKELAKLYKAMKVNPENAGIDLYVPKAMKLFMSQPITLMSELTIDHEVQCQMCVSSPLLNEVFDIHYFMLPRSSISKYPMMLRNGIGLIDSSYRGNIMAKVMAWGSVDIHKHSRLFQIVPKGDYNVSRIEVVHELSESERGTSGFGSTGT